MSKRRRTPSIASRSVDEDTNESDSQSVGAMETSRKKRKLDPVRKPPNVLFRILVSPLKCIYLICFLLQETNSLDISIPFCHVFVIQVEECTLNL